MTPLDAGETPAVIDAYALRLGGCRVLLNTPQACLDVLRSLQAAVAAAQRDGFRAPPRIVHLIRILEAERAEHATSAGGNAELPQEPDVPQFVQPTEAADIREAAEMLGLSTRQVRNLGPRLDGRKIGGVWTFDRDILAAEAQRRRHLERTT